MRVREEEGIRIYSVGGESPGEDLTVFGGVHGNEHCGPKAIGRIIGDIEEGKIQIKSGSLTLVPVANPLACEKNRRFVNHNLNRSFYPREEHEITCPEHRYMNVLAPLLQKPGGYFLDLHSYSAQGRAFAIMGGDRPEEYMRFAGALGAPNMIGGWEDVCERSEHFEDERAGQGTSNYARLPGNSMHSLTLECGHHNDPQAPEVGYRAVLNTLRTLGMADIAGDLGGAEGEENRSRLIRLESVQFKTRDGDLTRDWVNMDPVREGEVIAVFSDGEELRACRDGFVVMPHRSLDINAEWFFFGVEEDG